MSLIERRIGLLFALFAAALFLIVARAAWLQGVRGSELRADAQGQQAETVAIPGTRGLISDRNGKELAVSEDAETIFATPYQVKNPTQTAEKLGAALHEDPEEILKLIADRDSGFVYVAHKASLTTADQISKMDLPGIGTLPDSRRVYPQGELASQVIGSVSAENDGLTGLEASQEELLQGPTGEREIVRDAHGKEIERNTLAPTGTGSDLQLTIDATLQEHTEEVLAGIEEDYSPKGATAIVMDPQTGEILALANTPAYDPADPASATPQELANRATGYTFEPGSTFKAFTVAGALEDELVTPETTFQLPPSIRLYDRTIRESHPRGPVTLSVADILAQSSNVGAVKIGLALNEREGDERFDYWIRRFGFGSPTGVEFPGEEQGIVLEPEEYSGTTMGNLPLGQGLAVTPMQMVAAYAAIANGGILREPQLIRAKDGERIEPPEGERIMSSENAAKVRQMLEGVLAPGGTASEVVVDGYTLAGKTGTAEKEVGGTYSKTKFVASFVGFAPADNPELLVSIVVDEPEGADYYGGTVAAPAFGEIATMALPYLGVPASG